MSGASSCRGKPSIGKKAAAGEMNNNKTKQGHQLARGAAVLRMAPSCATKGTEAQRREQNFACYLRAQNVAWWIV